MVNIIKMRFSLIVSK